MPALSDRTFNPKAWARLGLVAVGLGVVAGLVWLTSWAHENFVEMPRLLEKRHDDPPGKVGRSTTAVARLGAKAVPTLLADLDGGTPEQRSKSLELLATIDDPRVVPALGKALQDPDLGVRLAALAGLGRTGKPTAAEHLWPLANHPDEFVRLKAVVALGLSGGKADADKLLAEAAKVTGHERYVTAWAAGRILRRLERKDGYLPAAPVPESDADATRVQAEVGAVHAALDAGKDLAEHARRLSELTDLSFSTWDFAHQIAMQVLAVRGPLGAVHTTSGADVVPPRPTERRLELQLER